MRMINLGKITCVFFRRLYPTKEKGVKHVVFRGGRQARSKGRWANANILARLKRRVLGPFQNAADVWRASRRAERGFRLGMGFGELKARMKREPGGWLPWYVYRFKRARPLPVGELVWPGSSRDGPGGEFLESDGGARFYVPGGPSQPSKIGPPISGVLPGRWKAMHATRKPIAGGVRGLLPTVPRKQGRELVLFPEDDDPRIDLTNSGAFEELAALEEGIWESAANA